MTEPSPPTVPLLPPGAVLYTPDTEDRGVLLRFARDLAARGWRVGGVVQEPLVEDGTKVGMDVVEVDTGRHIPLARPTPGQIADGTCALDRGALAESTEAIRRAVRETMDLVVIEKFSEQERTNRGLAQEILLAMAEDRPTLVAVPAQILEDWNRFSGGLGVLLPNDMDALWRWWGPHRLYRDLVLGVQDEPIRRVVAGDRLILVEGPGGCGVAPRPVGPLPAVTEGTSLQTLAEDIQSWDRTKAALGLAAANAHYNRPDLAQEGNDGADIPAELDGPVMVVGHLPRLAARLDARRLTRSEADPETFPPTAARWLLPHNEGVVIAASALLDKTLPGVLESCRMADTVLVGAATPLTPRLHAYGLSRLSGMVVTDADGAAKAVEEGAGPKDLGPYCASVTLAVPNA